MHLIVLHHLAQGGRYDGIGEHFGRARPATGFSCDYMRFVLLNLLKLKRCRSKGNQQDLLKQLQMHVLKV
jgi:ATP phosphoribosyltransferase regulatory subunit